MTRKEQTKILDDKIKTNKRQSDLDRTNAEISAYSSGNLPKYEYLSKKDLSYKPDALEQARFEYSPSGKVFIDGLDKSDKNKELLRRLKDIEDKNNNQLLAIRDAFRPAIRNRNNGFRNGNNDDDSDDDSDDNDNNDDYILSEVIKQKYKKEGTLDASVNKEVYNMIKKSKKLEGKKYIIIENDKPHIKEFKNDYQNIINKYDNKEISKKGIKNMIDNVNEGIKTYVFYPKRYKNKLNIYDTKEFLKGLNHIYAGIKDQKITVGKRIISDSGKSIDMSWMNNFSQYKYIANEVKNRYRKNTQSPELRSIQLFIDNINNEHIESKKDMNEEFKIVKKNVKDNFLKDIVKNSGLAIFG